MLRAEDRNDAGIALQCREALTSVCVATGASFGSGPKLYRVVYRINDNKAIEQFWPPSTSGQAVCSPNAISFIKALPNDARLFVRTYDLDELICGRLVHAGPGVRSLGQDCGGLQLACKVSPQRLARGQEDQNPASRSTTGRRGARRGRLRRPGVPAGIVGQQPKHGGNREERTEQQQYHPVGNPPAALRPVHPGNFIVKRIRHFFSPRRRPSQRALDSGGRQLRRLTERKNQCRSRQRVQ